MRALITGITGFVGGHLAEHVLRAEPDAEVFGMRRWRSPLDEIAGLLGRVHLLDGDLLDASSLQRVLKASAPDVVYHLAASSSVAASWETPNEVLQINAAGTLHLLEALRQLELRPVVVLACSAEAYGFVEPHELPIGEDQPFRPASPYAVSKATVDMLGYQYFRTYGLRTIRLRLFNHAGPRQSDRFVVSSLARRVAAIEAGLEPPTLPVGDLTVRRDFVDVRDVVSAYLAVAARGVAGRAYNVCSGEARAIREVVDTLLARSRVDIAVATDPARLRPADIPVLEGDPSRLRADTGWSSEIPFARTVSDTLDYWRGEIGGPR